VEKANHNLPVRYRPDGAEAILGNSSIKHALKGWLLNNSFPRSLLLYGETGCGKTTTARILSRLLNCDDPGNGFTPCGCCPSCRLALENHPSIHEVNCTVRRRLDDMLHLIRISGLVPRHKHRVFILDEIQGATQEAINALLKPLEEPPPRTMWILCTSEPGKVPKPITGRCVQLGLAYPSPIALKNWLRQIAREEFGPDVARLLRPYLVDIVDQCEGQPRSAIELMGLVGTALTGDQNALSDQVLAKRIVESFLDEF
jgi:DNA polymerase-3 subunit gamma/tau